MVCQALFQVFMDNKLSNPHKVGTSIIPTLQMGRLQHRKLNNAALTGRAGLLYPGSLPVPMALRYMF